MVENKGSLCFEPFEAAKVHGLAFPDSLDPPEELASTSPRSRSIDSRSKHQKSSMNSFMLQDFEQTVIELTIFFLSVIRTGVLVVLGVSTIVPVRETRGK